MVSFLSPILISPVATIYSKSSMNIEIFIIFYMVIKCNTVTMILRIGKLATVMLHTNNCT